MAARDGATGEAIRKLEEQVNCPICLDTYNEPKLLQCSHVYCKKCLVSLASRNQQSRCLSKPLLLVCPICRVVTPVVGEVATLQPAFQSNQIIDVLKDLKANQNSSGPESEAQTSAGVGIPKISLNDDFTASDTTTVFCSIPEHKREVCNLFCLTCNALICVHCTIKEHHSHCYNMLSIEYEKSKIEFTSSLAPLDEMAKKLEEVLSDIATRGKAILDKKAAIEVEVCSTMQLLHQVLDDRQAELMGELERVSERKLCSLTVEKDCIDAKLCPLNSFRDNIKETIRTSCKEDLLKVKNSLLKEVEQKTNSFQPDTSVTLTKADMKFSYSSYINDNCRYYGNIYAPGFPHPSKCRAEGKGLETATVGVVAMLQLTLFNYHGELCKEGIVKSIECKLVSKISGAVKTYNSIDRKDGSHFSISYLPSFRGEHLLHIDVEGEPIRESPFAVKVDCPIENLGVPIHMVSGLHCPCGIAFTPTGDIVIAEKNGQDISILSSTGHKLHTFNVSMDVGPVLHCGVAVDKKGNIFVVDTYKHHIRKLTSSGEFIAEVGSIGNGIMQFVLPHDIAFNKTDDRLYIIDENNRVQVLNSDLSFFRMFGQYGSGNTKLNSPQSIACSRSGNVYVADTNNHRVMAFNTEGKYLKKYIKSANNRQFSPISIAVDANDYVYVGEADNHISIFSPEGIHKVSIGLRTGSNRPFRSFSIAVQRNDLIYVCDTENDQVQIF